ncbi:hypothetical protein NECAME_01734 [Necator americanus]|uniref:Uncharacterized protein n=1 Tax=Necator americanus TaxID=51031 RepID=W2TS46_NECAM|nr:hypothetical protein NECAME_01734 [Necator americanus]ETN83941.1 hypothetical protein NECAME_01734 [Necator americanus]
MRVDYETWVRSVVSSAAATSNLAELLGCSTVSSAPEAVLIFCEVEERKSAGFTSRTVDHVGVELDVAQLTLRQRTERKVAWLLRLCFTSTTPSHGRHRIAICLQVSICYGSHEAKFSHCRNPIFFIDFWKGTGLEKSFN